MAQVLLHGYRRREWLQHHQGCLLPDGPRDRSTNVAGESQERLHRQFLGGDHVGVLLAAHREVYPRW
jgi:hypothetical protein